MVGRSYASMMSSSRYSDCLTVVCISIITAILCESISWLLIYRTNSYKSLKYTIDKASKKLESLKSSDNNNILLTTTTTTTNKPNSKSKKIDRVETTLKDSTRDLSLFKFKSGAVVAFVLFIVFGLLNSMFEGRSVAKIPFVPIRLVQKMSHRGLHGDDFTDCSMAFLYFLCSISIRTNLQKLLGFAPPRGSTSGLLFPIPDPKTN